MNEKTEWQQGGNNCDIRELIYLKCVWNISRASSYRMNQVDNATYGIVKGKISMFLYVK